MKKLLCFLLLWLCKTGFTQGLEFRRLNGGIQTGIVVGIGTHDWTVGLQLKGYVALDNAQLNLGNTFAWKIYSLANRKHFFENRSYFGAAVMLGKNSAYRDFELDGLNHQSNKAFAVAYNYLVYWDNAGTSQLSGAFGLHIKNVSIKLENDVFAGQARDRFRTGILIATYKSELFKINAGAYIWTGETRGSQWQKIRGEKMPSGFRLLEDLPYGKTSHGILYGGVQYLMPYGNIIQLKAGIDSEHFRHAFQNRLTHDLIILPKKVQRNTPHYPRLDENGCPVFEKESVRKDKFYFQVGLND